MSDYDSMTEIANAMLKHTEEGMQRYFAEAEQRASELAQAREEGRKQGLDEAAALVRDWTSDQHIAHDRKKGTFPKVTPTHDAMSEAITALKDKEPGK